MRNNFIGRILDMATENSSEIFGTRVFRARFDIIQSTQAVMRKNGLPHYRVPNSSKIIYKEAEVLAWLTSQKGASIDA